MRNDRTCRSVRGLLLAVGAALASTTVAYAQPANDDCATPTVLTVPGTSGDSTGATGTDISTCAFGDALDVWYTFTAGAAANYTFDTEGSGVDTVLSLWSDCGVTQLACDDDGGTGLLSRIVWSLSAGQVVYVRYAGYNGVEGPFTLNVNQAAPPAGNDDCAGATVISPGSSTPGSTSGATGTDITSCTFQDTNDVWFRLNTTSAGFHLIDTIGTGLDTSVSVFTACGGAELGCNDDIPGQGIGASQVNVNLNAASSYWIRVAGYNNIEGAFVLNVGTAVAPPTAPANDLCTGATNITTLPFTDATTDIAGATDDADLASCNAAAATVTPQGVWYRYTPAVNGRIRVREDSPLNTFLSVFTNSGGCGGSFTEVPGTCGFNVVFDVAAGTTYYILVGTAATGGLPPPAVINLVVEAAPGPTNDNCASATAILPGSTTAGTNLNAAGTDITTCAFGDTDDVWYALAVTTPGSYQIDTEGSVGLNDTTLSLFDACGGTEVACDDDSGTGFLSILRPILNAGTYYIRVAGYGGAEGVFQLNVSNVITAPANDTCSAAAPIAPVPSSVTGTNLGATSDVASTSCAFTPTDALDVWYSFTPTTTDFYVFDTEGSTTLLDTTVSVWSACGGSEVGCDDDNGTGLLSRLNISLNSGTTYYVRVAGWNNQVGSFQLNASVGAPPPAGDTCAGAVVVTSPSSTQGDTTTFTSDLADSSCSFGDNIDAWFSFTPSTSATYTIDTLNSTVLLDTTLAIFDACGGTELYCNDDIDLAGDNLLSSIDAALNAGSTYFIRVSGFFGDVGAFQLNIAGGGAPVNGACCSGTTCSLGTVATCTGANTTFSGVGTVCNVPGNFTTPCCKADYNHVGGITVQDIFDFLAGYFNVNAQADINGGGVSVADIFDFLAAYFAGCP